MVLIRRQSHQNRIIVGRANVSGENRGGFIHVDPVVRWSECVEVEHPAVYGNPSIDPCVVGSRLEVSVAVVAIEIHGNRVHAALGGVLNAVGVFIIPDIVADRPVAAEFERADIDRRSDNAVKPVAALIGSQRRGVGIESLSVVARVDSPAAQQQSVCQRRSVVVVQRSQHRIFRSSDGSVYRVRVCIKPRRIVNSPDEVVRTARIKTPVEVVRHRSVSGKVAGHNGVVKRNRPAYLIDAAAFIVRRAIAARTVGGDSAVPQNQRSAADVDAAGLAISRHVPAECAIAHNRVNIASVAQVQPPAIAVTLGGGCVILPEQAVGYVQRAGSAYVHAAADRRPIAPEGAVGNRHIGAPGLNRSAGSGAHAGDVPFER